MNTSTVSAAEWHVSRPAHPVLQDIDFTYLSSIFKASMAAGRDMLVAKTTQECRLESQQMLDVLY